MHSSPGFEHSTPTKPGDQPELSYSKVRAITRAATPETEQYFIDVAMHATATQIEQLAHAYQRVHNLPGDSWQQQLGRRRFVRRCETPGGMIRIELQLPPEEAALVWNAMQSAMDQRDEAPAEASDPPPAPVTTQASAEAQPRETGEGVEERRADAVVDVARAYLQHRPRTLGSGYELVVITTPEQLENGSGQGRGIVGCGTPNPVQRNSGWQDRVRRSEGPRHSRRAAVRGEWA
jgi:hypothetical protein